MREGGQVKEDWSHKLIGAHCMRSLMQVGDGGGGGEPGVGGGGGGVGTHLVIALD